MSIVFCEEQFQRQASVTKDGTTRNRQFIVKSDSSNDDTPTIEAAPGISLFAMHPNDGSVYCSTITTTEIAERVFTVNFTYEEMEDPCEINPLTCPVEITWSTEKEEEIFKVDVDGDKVVNSLNEPFQPLPTRLKSRVVCTVQWNAASFNGAFALSIDSKTNSDTYQGAEPDTLLSSIESAVLKWHKTIGYYWQIRVKLTYNEDKWNPMKVMDTGVNEKVNTGTGYEKKRILVRGREVSHPVPLDGNGQPLGPDQEPVYLDFEPYEQIDYSATFG